MWTTSDAYTRASVDVQAVKGEKRTVQSTKSRMDKDSTVRRGTQGATEWGGGVQETPKRSRATHHLLSAAIDLAP